jgi:metal-sulfur cluster biosynthetic enzyme
MVEADNTQQNTDTVVETQPDKNYHPDAEAIEAKVRDALRHVVDPEIGLDVVALGLIREIEVYENKLHVIMILTTPFCPYGPQLLEQTRRTAQEAAELPTTIEMGLQMWDPSMMEDGIADDWGLF